MRKDFTNGLSTLFYLMITADGIIDDRELELGEIMIKHERINKNAFYKRIEACSQRNTQSLYNECICSLKKCGKNVQIKSMAWMSLAAKIDGHVSPKEAVLLDIISAREFKLESEQVIKEENRLATKCKLALD
jgi:hypothetical protein